MKRTRRARKLPSQEPDLHQTEQSKDTAVSKAKQKNADLKEETVTISKSRALRSGNQISKRKQSRCKTIKHKEDERGQGSESETCDQESTLLAAKVRKVARIRKSEPPLERSRKERNNVGFESVKNDRSVELVGPGILEVEGKNVFDNDNESSEYFTDTNEKSSNGGKRKLNCPDEVSLSSKLKKLKKVHGAKGSRVKHELDREDSNMISSISVMVTDCKLVGQNQDKPVVNKSRKSRRMRQNASEDSNDIDIESTNISKSICSVKKSLEEDFTNIKKELGNSSKRALKNTTSSRKNTRNENKLLECNDILDLAEVADGKNSVDVNQTKALQKVKKEDSCLPAAIDHSDIRAVLLHMEGQVLPVCKPSTSKGAVDVEDDVMSDTDSSDDDHSVKNQQSDESEDEWEDVEDHHGNSPRKSQIPDKPVEITLEAPVIYKKRKKKEFDLQAYFRRKMNRYQKELLTDMHKVHLMCLLSRCMYYNRLCEGETVRAQIMSVIVGTKAVAVPPQSSCRLIHVQNVFQWIKREFPLAPKSETAESGGDMELVLQSCIENRQVTSPLEFTLICVITLRQLGFLTRLVMSLQPIPLKSTASKGVNTKGKSTKKSKVENPKKQSSVQSAKNVKSEKKSKSEKPKKAGSKSKQDDSLVTAAKGGNGGSKKSGGKGGKDSGSCGKRLSRKCSETIRKGAYTEADGELESDNEYVPDCSPSSSDDESPTDNTGKSGRKGRGKGPAPRKTSTSDQQNDEGSDSDFEEDTFKVRTPPLRTKPASRNKKVLSSDSDDSESSLRGTDEWLEIFMEKEQQWICIDCASGKTNKPYELEHSATQPVSYVVGIDQGGNVKDVTARYASQWLVTTRKLRVEQDWWEDTLLPYRNNNMEQDEIEDRGIQELLMQSPLPTSISAFKNHPMFALKRHLLKFEALYPDTAVPLGYIRGEPVFARECVHTLHSRENWLKEGRAVRLGEEAYKFVKSRPKWNKPKADPEAKDLELYGIWQTEVYIPPPAVDGKVPRNAHGNVEMFLPSMLPAGTVHLKLPGLNKIAKKLDIDCAPAMIGWDHHCGFSHPLMDGWIVCEEFKDILLAAWDEDQEIQREKEAEKREKRVYENWKKLIRGMLIKERLKKRFDLEEKTEVENKPAVDKPVEKAVDAQHAWPQCRMENSKQHTLCTVETI